MTALRRDRHVEYGHRVRRPLILLAIIGSGLGVGATALAQGGGGDKLSVSLQRGCLNSTRVAIRISPGDGQILSPVHVRVGDEEVVHLSGVTQEASVAVRVPTRHGRVSVRGETTGGRSFSFARTYRPCAPEPPATPRRNAHAEPTLSGGGEG